MHRTGSPVLVTRRMLLRCMVRTFSMTSHDAFMMIVKIMGERR